MVSSAIKTLLSNHIIVQVKTTKTGAASRYDLSTGPYALAAREGIEPPATRGAPDVELLKFAASEQCVTDSDIVKFAASADSETKIDPEMMKLYGFFHQDDFVPAAETVEERPAFEEPEGTDEMPERNDDDGGEYAGERVGDAYPHLDIDTTAFEI